MYFFPEGKPNVEKYFAALNTWSSALKNQRDLSIEMWAKHTFKYPVGLHTHTQIWYDW